MDEPLDMNKLGKGRKGPWDKQLDCEGIDISAEKGKVNIIELEELVPYMTKIIAKRVDKWEYSGGHVGHLWKDLAGKKHDNIKDIIESYYGKNKNPKFIIDWERGELLAYE